MKKIFFFICLFFLPLAVSASSIKDLVVKNGTLSRKFEESNNIYSVLLNETESELKIEYELADEQGTVEIKNNQYIDGEENVVTLEVTNSDNTKEQYVFYLEKEEAVPVFKESTMSTPNKKERSPYLIWYVSTGCLCIILLLFKVIVLGFKKKKK